MKIVAIIIAVFIFIFFLILLSHGFQAVSTDKKVYSAGEKIKIHSFDFQLCWCICGNYIKIYKFEENKWNELTYQLWGYGGACVDGKPVPMAMHADFCSGPQIAAGGSDFLWNSMIYKKTEINETMDKHCQYNYIHIPVTPGSYKVKYGSAEKIFEIR